MIWMILRLFYASQAEAGGQSGFVYAKNYPSAEIQLFRGKLKPESFLLHKKR